MSNTNDPPSEPPDEGTAEGKSEEKGPVQDDTSREDAGRRRPLLTFLFWLVALGFSAAVAFSNHWLADMALALLPIGLIGIFIAVGIVMLLRK